MSAPESGFDLDATLARVGGDRELLREIARLCVEDTRRTLAEIESAIQAGDAARLERQAHSLKGALANFGAPEAVQAALALEIMGRHGDLKRAPDGLARLAREWERLRPVLLAL